MVKVERELLKRALKAMGSVGNPGKVEGAYVGLCARDGILCLWYDAGKIRGEVQVIADGDLEPILVPYSDLLEYVKLLRGKEIELGFKRFGNGEASLRLRGENVEVGLWTARETPDGVPNFCGR